MDNRGLVDLAKLRSSFDKADFKHGKNSYCFIQGDQIIKVYARKYGEPMPKNVCDFSKYKADTIVFPIEYIYENGQVVGEISKYIKSEAISSSFDEKANVNRIIKSFESVLGDMYLYQDIDMQDLCYVNILYSNRLGFHIIDTTEWEIKKDSLRNNVHRLNISLIDALVEYLELPVIYSKYFSRIDENFYNNMAKFGPAGKNLQENMTLLMYNKYHFFKLMSAYMDAYRVYSGNEAKTLGDVEEFVKVLKKS